jgi:hypothetical protein
MLGNLTILTTWVAVASGIVAARQPPAAASSEVYPVLETKEEEWDAMRPMGTA